MKKIPVGAIAVLLLLLTSCSLSLSSDSEKLIGTWSSGSLITYVFKSDHTVTMTGLGTSNSGTWDLTGTILTINWADSTEESAYIEFSNNNATMTLTPTSGGFSLTFVKQ